MIRLKLSVLLLLLATLSSFAQSLTVQITFASNPTSAVATVPNQKFDKKNTFSLDFDDVSNSAGSALTFLNTKHFTDGCGNNISYRFGVGINGANTFNGLEYTFDGSNGSQTTKAKLLEIIAAGGDLSDHSYYHDPVGYGASTTAAQNTTLCYDFISRLFNGYKTRTKIVPSNNAGHAQAAYDQSYLASISESTFDSFTPEGLYNPRGLWSNVTGFPALKRFFTDTWNSSQSGLKSEIDYLLTQTNGFMILGSHTIDNQTAFESVFNYLETNSADNVWIASTREILEFREMKALPMSQNLVGNVLTITINTSGLNTKNRFRDMTFKIASDKNIIGITTNATSSSYSNTTHIVNVFKQGADSIIPTGLPKGINYELN